MTPACAPVATAELGRALGRLLEGDPAAVTILERRPFPYRSTYPLDELRLRLADGTERRLVFKDLSRSGAAGAAAGVKAAFLDDPLREIETYRDVLAPHGLSAPRYLGAVIEPGLGGAGRYWLFLEHVRGDLLWQVEEMEDWRRAARWLAAMHGRFAERTWCLPRRLLAHDAEYYRRWLERARRTVRWPRATTASGRDFGWLARRTLGALDWLAEQPVTLLHGEFYPSNVLVEPAPGGRRIRPVDWEMTGTGSGLLDLAALTSGGWGEAEREELAEAYRSALPGWLRPSPERLRCGLDRCRLLLAVQWLGWSTRWTPPPEHAHDWLTTAIELATEVPA